MSHGFVSSIIFFAASAAVALPVSADVLYKLIDKNGKVTYSESKPDNFDGQVIRIDVNPDANTMAAPKPSQSSEDLKGPTENEKIIRRRVVNASDKLQVARDKADEACKAFETARDNPTDNDVVWMAVGAGPPQPSGPPVAPAPQPPPTGPTVPNQSKPPVVGPNPIGKRTGARPVPTDEYLARLAGLEKTCNDAKEELRVSEGASK